MLTVNELFAGIGAFRKAIDRLGIPYKIVGISEIDKFAIASYNAIYGETRNYGDISKVDNLDYADLWTYGFPCQDISLAGQKRGIIRGETRSGLLYEVQRLLTQAALDDELPKYLIMENVKNLVGKKFRKAFDGWLSWLDCIGYNSFWEVTNAADYDVPQKRERVIVVSVRKDLPIAETFRFPTPLSQTRHFYDLLENDPDERYYLSGERLEYYENHSKECKERGLGFRFTTVKRENCEIAKTLTKKPDRMEANYIDERPIVNCKMIAKLKGSKWDNYESTARIYGTDGLCPTLTTCGGGNTEVKKLAKSGVRKLTPREYWRLMGFDDCDFDKANEVSSNTQLYKQAGNSIVVNVLQGIMGNLLVHEASRKVLTQNEHYGLGVDNI